MADLTINFSALGSSNPYTNAVLTQQVGSIKNVSGSGINAHTNGTNNQTVHNVAYGDIIRADITVGANDTSDIIGPAIVIKTGANAFKGYLYYCAPGEFLRLAKLDGTGFWTDLSGETFVVTAAPGDIVSISYQLSTQTLIGYYNNSAQNTTTDSTYSAETTMAAGFIVDPANVNGSFITSFSGTGVASGGGAVFVPNTPSGSVINLGSYPY